MIDLTGRVALVTGGLRGIGRACALRLAEAGADVIVNYVTAETAAREVAGEILGLGRRTAVVRADVSEADDCDAMMDFIEGAFGKLDILVSNAATGGFRPLLSSTVRNFEATMKTNALALIQLLQSGLRLLERAAGRGKVVVLSSHGSHLALPMYGMIGGSKARWKAWPAISPWNWACGASMSISSRPAWWKPIPHGNCPGPRRCSRRRGSFGA